MIAPVAAHDARPAGAADNFPARIDLPDGFQPEGIESRGGHLYAGSIATGAIWQADARTGAGRYLVAGATGGSAAGLHIDASFPTTGTIALGRLWVVNARFDVTPTPDTEYWISRLPLAP
jgi:hypothetical protein